MISLIFPYLLIILYADDILYFHPVISSSCMTSIQNDLNTISEWISSHFLSINTNKSKYMIITRKSSQFVFSLPPVTLMFSLAVSVHECIPVLLISAGANLNIQSNVGLTALMIAVYNNGSVVRILLNAQADVNAQDQLGNTALHHSASLW